jgi:hypothetical protein
MSLAELQQKLIAAARTARPGDQVPYAFVSRVMALLPVQPGLDSRAVWARALWRAALCYLAITLLFSALTFFSSLTGASPNDPSPDYLAQDFEKTMLASVDQDLDSFPSP